MLLLDFTKDKSVVATVNYNKAKGLAKKVSIKKVMQSASSETIVQTSNVNTITSSHMEKLGQSNEMFANLQEMTNKQVEKYTGLLPEYRYFKQWGNRKEMANRMCKQRRTTAPTR